ncbi:MAG TPA: hypothetical protein VF469_11010 [Kofleriaceae bacterium]
MRATFEDAPPRVKPDATGVGAIVGLCHHCNLQLKPMRTSSENPAPAPWCRQDAVRL